MNRVNDNDGWDLVSEWLNSEIEQRGLTLRKIETEGGVAYRTLQKLLDGEPVSRRDSLARLATFFEYQADAVDRVRRGERPVPAHASTIDLADELGRDFDPDDVAKILQIVEREIRKQQS